MRLGDMLLNAKVVTELQLNAAIAEQQRWGGKLGQILVRMGALSEDLLVMALCRQLSLPRADLDAVLSVPEALRQRIDRATCERYRILPLAYIPEKRTMQLAMSDPFDVAALDDLTRMLGTRIEPFLAGDNALGNAVRRLYASASTTTSFADDDPMSLVDNAGNPRGAPRPPAPRAPPPPAARPAATPAPAAPADAAFAARVEEQARAVRAVADLLLAHGVIRPEELPR